MKFEEANAKKYIRVVEEKRVGHIYFLMDKDEVVYVGQTKFGTSRPLQHKDKVFDSFYMKECPIPLLDKQEREMILKYKPKYNKNYNNDEITMSLYEVQKKLKDNGYIVRWAFLTKIIGVIGIKLFEFNSHKSINREDFEAINRWVDINYDLISEQQNQSLKINFFENPERELEFCGYISSQKFDERRILGKAGIKDLIYFGEITEKEIEKYLREFKDRNGY
jgi:predicted GIY-YIG superfamily endonuclease